MKKFILRIMACLMMAVMIGTCFGSVGTVLADDTEVAYNGTVTFSDKTWWTEKQVTPEEVLGSVAPEDVVNIVFTSDTAFALGFNTNAEGNWLQLNEKTEYDVNNMWFGEGNCIKFALSKGDGVDYTITWKVYVKAAAPVETPAEEPKAEEPKAEEPKAEEPKTEEPKTEAPAADLVALDINENPFLSGAAPTANADGSISFKDGKSMKASFVLPETLAAGESITVNVKLQFGSADDTAVRFYLIANASDVNIATEIQTIANEATGSTVEKTFVLTAASDATELLFASSSYGTYIKDVTIYDITLGEKPAAPVETPVETPVVVPETSDNTTTGREVKEGETVYTVQKGDCLWTIAKTFLGSGKRYTELFERNSDILTDATLIKKGQEIIIPAK